MAERELWTVPLGRVPYNEALELQRSIARDRISGAVPQDVLLLLEHPPVVTLGRSSKEKHLVASPEFLQSRGVELFEVERGGDATFHGPGQLVGYPIVDLKRHRQDLHWYLRTKDSFTTYSRLDHDTLVLLVSAAYRDTLKPYTWWFPIVGRVPYKGYFDFDAAKRTAKDLVAEGFDVYVRPSDAFSTLGFFNDPLLNTTLRDDSIGLTNTVIHELTHNTFYASGQAPFNESFAMFVGARGGAAFFRSRGQAAAAAKLDAEWEDDKVLARFWSRVIKSLDSAYAAHPSDKAARIGARDTVYIRTRAALVGEIAPQLKTINPRYAERVPLDNASLLARSVYASDLDVFDLIYEKEGRDLKRTIGRVIGLAKANSKAPFAALRKWVGLSPGSVPAP